MNEYRPYVISTDLQGLFTRWGRAEGLYVPGESYFQGFRAELASELNAITGAEVIILPENELRRLTNEAVRNSTLPVVSLDRAYVGSSNPRLRGFLDMTRAVDGNLNKIGLMARIGAPSLEDQYAALRNADPIDVALVDDVIFHGGGVIEAAAALRERSNLIVRKVIATVGIEEGVETVRNAGLDVDVLYPFREVLDEVCERDFFPAAPMSGRMLVDNGKEYSAPYILPFGDPVEWATIPKDYAHRFSDTCRRLAIDLWSKIEKMNSTVVEARRAPRRVKGFSPEHSIVYNLQHH